MISVGLANFVRDVLSSLIEIVFNIAIVCFLKKFYYDRIRLTGQPAESLSKVEKTNMIITIIISSLSILMHIATFLVGILCHALLRQPEVAVYFSCLFTIFSKNIKLFKKIYIITVISLKRNVLCTFKFKDGNNITFIKFSSCVLLICILVLYKLIYY